MNEHKNMRIGIDVRSLTTAGLGRGLATYTLNVVKSLLTLDRENDYCLFVAKNQPFDEFFQEFLSTERINVVELRRPTRNIVFWDQLLWYRILKKERIDVFHSLIYGVPLLCPCYRVLTIHDLTPFIFPEFIKDLRHKIVFRCNFSTGKFADHIVTSSQNSKRDIMQHLHLSDDRISVIFDGVSEHYTVLSDTTFLKNLTGRYQIPGRFLLYVGGFDHNKNLPTLVNAFHALVQQHSQFRETLALVFVGALTEAAKSLQAYVKTRGIEKQVIFTGFVPERDLIGLYNAAEIFVFPSLYEGFGLPPLEAMACGTPVISSNASSLPEVVGNAGIHIDPHSPEDLTQAIVTLLMDEALRRQLQCKGLERAALFSWEKTARQTLDVYNRIFHVKQLNS